MKKISIITGEYSDDIGCEVVLIRKPDLDELEQCLEIALDALIEMKESLYFERNTKVSILKVVNAIRKLNNEKADSHD